MLKTILTNWKTTFLGGSPSLAVVLLQLAHLLDGDPATKFGIEAFLVAAGALAMSLFARDGDKSSEESGVKTPVGRSA